MKYYHRYSLYTIEHLHEKTKEMDFVPNEDTDQLRHSLCNLKSLQCPMKKDLGP